MLDSLYNKHVVYPFVYSLNTLQSEAKLAANYIKDARIYLKNIQADVSTVSIQLIRCTNTQLQFCIRGTKQNGTTIQHTAIYNISTQKFQEAVYIDKNNSYVSLNTNDMFQAVQTHLPLCAQCFSFAVKPLQLFIQAPMEAYINLQKNEPSYIRSGLKDAARLQALYNCSITIDGNALNFAVIGGETQIITTWQVWGNSKDFQIDKKYKGLYSINGYSENLELSFGRSVIAQLNQMQTTLVYTLQPGVQV